MRGILGAIFVHVKTAWIAPCVVLIVTVLLTKSLGHKQAVPQLDAEPGESVFHFGPKLTGVLATPADFRVTSDLDTEQNNDNVQYVDNKEYRGR